MTIISPLPTAPSRSNPATFAEDGDAFLGALGTFQVELNTLAEDMNTKANQVSNDTTIVTSVKDVVLGAVNYKGDWQVGTYALNESVSHDGKRYISKINNNTDIPTSDSWLDISSYTKEEVDAKFTLKAGTTATLDLNADDMLKHTVVADTTFTFTNIPTVAVWTVELVNGGDYTLTFPANVKWEGGVAPTLTTDIDVLQFYTSDSGISIYAKALFLGIA